MKMQLEITPPASQNAPAPVDSRQGPLVLSVHPFVSVKPASVAPLVTYAHRTAPLPNQPFVGQTFPTIIVFEGPLTLRTVTALSTVTRLVSTLWIARPPALYTPLDTMISAPTGAMSMGD